MKPRLFVPVVALLLLVACAKPQDVVVPNFGAFIELRKSPVAALGDEDRRLFLRFAAEYEAKNGRFKPQAGKSDMPTNMDGKTLGQILEIAREYYANKERAASRNQARPLSTQRSEYSGGGEVGGPALAYIDAATVARLIEAEAKRGGPRDEPRIFESPQEWVSLAGGVRPKFMNAQFRYYLADVSLIQPAESGCTRPLLAVKLAIENQHQQVARSIYGAFTFSEVLADGALPGQIISVPYHADILGPFEVGGTTYVTALMRSSGSGDDETQWQRIASLSAARRRVWFAPEAFYYPDGEQYTQQTGRGPTTREPSRCGS